MTLIPPFSFHTVFIEPWTEFTYATTTTTLMAFCVAAACGLIGNFFILRRMALLGDAISHSLLPGIVAAFLVTTSRNPTILFLGALVSAAVTVFAIEFIQKHSKLKADAAMGITFSTAFALGVILLSLFADYVDLDTECVLFGELALLPLEATFTLGSLEVPYTLLRMILILVGLTTLIALFNKQLLVSIFDPTLAHILTISPKTFHYALTLILAVIVVSAFRSVGAILVVAMLLFPGSTARLMTNRISQIHRLTFALSAGYAILGTHLAHYLDCSIAGSITAVAFSAFLITWSIKHIRSVHFSPLFD